VTADLATRAGARLVDSLAPVTPITDAAYTNPRPAAAVMATRTARRRRDQKDPGEVRVDRWL
jgi:hypothetical protein